MRYTLVHSVIDAGILLFEDTDTRIVQRLNLICGAVGRKTVLDDDLKIRILLSKDVLHGLCQFVARIEGYCNN